MTVDSKTLLIAKVACCNIQLPARTGASLVFNKRLRDQNLSTLRYNSKSQTEDPMLPKDSFLGKVALVTGGGTGLGKGIAQKLCELGATVVIMSRKKKVVDLAANKIAEKTHGSVIGLQGDVRDSQQVRLALDALVEQAGIPQIVVNNAYV